jgi:(heptosyl)LPS beta-1,4-glucosyltransferase
MIKITSITIAKNEEKNIARCIMSLQNVVDEIIVVLDDQTTDTTESIIRSFPHVILTKSTWQGYSKSKEIGVSLASHDWIFWIDADEEVTPQLAEEISVLKDGSLENFSVYSIPRKAFFLGKWIKHSGWYPGNVDRLFNKQQVTFADKAVHEHLNFNGKVGQLKNDLNHYTDPNIEHYYTKFNIYTSLAAEELYKQSRTFSIVDITFRPVFLFIKMYFLRKGFLDGIQGFILAVSSAHYVFAKYAKLWELNKKE